MEFFDGTKRTLSDEQYEQLSCTIEQLKAYGRYNHDMGIKSTLQTYEKQYEEVKHSFLYINKPVILDEPQNVSRANCFPARKKTAAWREGILASIAEFVWVSELDY